MKDNPTNSNVASLILQIDAGQDADAEELNRLTHQLRSEIQELNIESVDLVRKEEIPEGAKSLEAVTLGSLVVTILPTLIPALIEFLKSWLMRGENRKIKIKTQIGDRLVEAEYSPTKTSQEDLKNLIDMLMGSLASDTNNTHQGVRNSRTEPIHAHTLSTSQKLALVIGNTEYEDPTLSQLVTPGADVHVLVDVLRDPHVGCFDKVIPFMNQPIVQVRREIARFFMKKKRDDLLFLYFSGHGVLDEQGTLYLAVRDTERDLLRATAIPATFITGEMDRSHSQRQVFILDCCHSGAFARGTKGASGVRVGTATVFEGNGYGRVVLTATDSTQYAWEGDGVIGEAENSVFTHYLIQGLQTGEADADADGWITLNDLYEYVYARVVRETPRQTPGKWSYKQQGEIVIARNPNPVIKPVDLPQELQQAIESPFTGVREGAVRDLDHLLRSGDKGLAIAAYAALEHMKDDDSRRVSAAAVESLAASAKERHVTGESTETPGESKAKQLIGIIETHQDKIDVLGETYSQIQEGFQGHIKHLQAQMGTSQGAAKMLWQGIVSRFATYTRVKWFSILLIIVGFSLADFIAILVGPYSRDWYFTVGLGIYFWFPLGIYGAIAGLFVGLAVWRIYPSIRKKQIFMICVGWSIIFSFTPSLKSFTWILFDHILTGTIGGLIIGLVLRRTGLPIQWRQVFIIAIGWIIGFAHGMLPIVIADRTVRVLFYATICGAIGGGVMFWQLSQIRQRK